mgnify:CR=1 FL=1
MKRSEKTALQAITAAIVAVFAVNHWLISLGWLGDLLLGAMVAGGWFQATLRIAADTSVIDSRSINQP